MRAMFKLRFYKHCSHIMNLLCKPNGLYLYKARDTTPQHHTSRSFVKEGHSGPRPALATQTNPSGPQWSKTNLLWEHFGETVSQDHICQRHLMEAYCDTVPLAGASKQEDPRGPQPKHSPSESHCSPCPALAALGSGCNKQRQGQYVMNIQI